MFGLLNGMRVVEAASFIAAPYCALSLAQLGAEVIRIDAIGGGPDFHRWPRAENGASLYWEGLNRSKKSIALNLGDPRGRELAAALITAPGEGAGLFVTNYPAEGFLAHSRLAARRPDLVTARVTGFADGASAVDYTVNCRIGLPLMTGPIDRPGEPVNHVLPAWDLLAGSTAALSLLAAMQARAATGAGQEIRVPLMDVAAATLSTLGQVAETALSGHDRPRSGNDLFGAFGRDFIAADGGRLMIVAITPKQWSGLVAALALGERIAALESELGVSFAKDEGLRFVHRERLNGLVAEAVAREPAAALAARFEAHGVCYGPYRSLGEALAAEPAFSPRGPLFSTVSHPGGTYATAGFPATFSGRDRAPSGRAPRLGENTDEVLATVLSLPDHEIAALHDGGVVAASGEK